MSHVRVFRDYFGDWYMQCDDHNDATFCSEWVLAYEAALGHLCMYHPPLTPASVWEEGALWAAQECGVNISVPWLVPGDNPYSR